ncbi:DNA endonuclease SmrA [Salinimonas sp. HHU 13199]|uniref:DNA endonuclease SmrA n=1 Tax=Salinimonas profundi TaxID=2729140 RepID=A0ABR8LGJ0_9ALTE|nr:DNA endonuclease SmrA [Salinimonas profundi]MBD3585374.1 DNA endonuclease SmrA [Salinimonas profundi]
MHKYDEELNAFLEEMDGVRPIGPDDKVHHHSPEQQIKEKQARARPHALHSATLNPLSMDGVTPVQPDDFLSYQQPGIQDGVFKNLRMGKYPIEYRLNLKGMPLKACRDAFYEEILKCHARGTRALLIQHGRGENSSPFPALKKSYVKHWLDELEEVIAYHTAQRQHGGTAATYVLLKKHPDQKLINREKNKKG